MGIWHSARFQARGHGIKRKTKFIYCGYLAAGGVRTSRYLVLVLWNKRPWLFGCAVKMFFFSRTTLPNSNLATGRRALPRLRVLASSDLEGIGPLARPLFLVLITPPKKRVNIVTTQHYLSRWAIAIRWNTTRKL